MGALTGKNIIVTGASKGLGRQLALTLHEEGANLVLAARSGERLEELAESLPGAEEEQETCLVEVDLAAPEGAEDLVLCARQEWDRLDGLVNNAAAVGPIGPLWQVPWGEFERTLHLDLAVPLKLCALTLPWLGESGGGSVVNLSGGGGTGPRPNFTAYAAAKVGIVRCTENLALEAAELGVRVNAVAPGALNTDMFDAALAAGPEATGAREWAAVMRQKESGGADPRRAAALCAFLLSDASAGVTGRLLSAVWDPWEELPGHLADLEDSDIYTLRRIIPKDRGMAWGER